MWRAIELTASIMRELAISPSQRNANRSYTEVERKLGVDEEMVRNRVKGLKETGLLLGWRLIVNARLLGMESSNVAFEFPIAEAKEKAILLIRAAAGSIPSFIASRPGISLALGCR